MFFVLFRNDNQFITVIITKYRPLELLLYTIYLSLYLERFSVIVVGR